MARGEISVSAYIPAELLKVLDEEVYRRGITRSGYLKDMLLSHFSKGDENLRVKLLGRDKKKEKK
jgi:hypothetical protein